MNRTSTRAAGGDRHRERDGDERSSARLTNCCARPSVIGRPGMISWSLPKAMFEPQKEIEPMIAANSDRDRDVQRLGGRRRVSRNSTQAISATAPPPTPLNSATICGIAVIFTLRAAGMPDRGADHHAER